MAEPGQVDPSSGPADVHEATSQAFWVAAEPQVAMLYQRALEGKLGAVQVWFDQRVLDRYRAQEGSRVIRTNTAGRVRTAAGWSLDFGIAADDRLVHTSVEDLAQRLPAAEHRHWASHLVTLPLSRTFVVMRLGAGSCMDDGDLRDW